MKSRRGKILDFRAGDRCRPFRAPERGRDDYNGLTPEATELTPSPRADTGDPCIYQKNRFLYERDVLVWPDSLV